MRVPRSGMVLPIIIFLFSGCMREGEAEQTALSGEERPNACTLLDATVPVFGPAEFRRAKGKPQTVTAIFDVPARGEVCLSVVNGSGPPPHGERISSAWLFIDDVLVIGPEAFSQNVGEISTPHAVEAGPHNLSVRLASVPGSFITVEIRFLHKDTEPPVLALQPANGDVLDTDMPLIRVAYRDDGVGVDLASLHAMLNGNEVTDRFAIGDDEAAWQVGIDDYLEEGPNDLSVTLSDRMGNEASATSIFLVATPTEVLLADMEHEDWRYRRRSAYKLLYRPDEITLYWQRRCLKQLAETPEPKASERLVAIIESTIDHISRMTAVTALGEAAWIDEGLRQDEEAVELLCDILLDQPAFSLQAAASRALGMFGGQRALDCLDEYTTSGPRDPPEPNCTPYPGLSIPQDCLVDQYARNMVGLQAVRASIRIAGMEHAVGNPGDMGEARRYFLERLRDISQQLEQSGGGAP
ncbi:MAG: HEAT repeat domain-containing protein [Deltaproteobacteria bacterium]|nr:MAG: HEAT repeat domain-containing protein [Deltaproteobacteria bacterium]